MAENCNLPIGFPNIGPRSAANCFHPPLPPFLRRTCSSEASNPIGLPFGYFAATPGKPSPFDMDAGRRFPVYPSANHCRHRAPVATTLKLHTRRCASPFKLLRECASRLARNSLAKAPSHAEDRCGAACALLRQCHSYGSFHRRQQTMILNWAVMFPCSAASLLYPNSGGPRQPLDRQLRYYSEALRLASELCRDSAKQGLPVNVYLPARDGNPAANNQSARALAFACAQHMRCGLPGCLLVGVAAARGLHSPPH